MTIYDHWLYRFLTGPLNNVAWLYILLPCVFAGGIYLTVGSGAVQFRRFGYAMKNTAGKLFKKQESKRIRTLDSVLEHIFCPKICYKSFIIKFCQKSCNLLRIWYYDNNR